MGQDKLLPCPFCGFEHPRVDKDEATKPPEQTHISYWVYCVACACEGSWGETREEAITLWNTRSKSPNNGKDEEPKQGLDYDILTHTGSEPTPTVKVNESAMPHKCECKHEWAFTARHVNGLIICSRCGGVFIPQGAGQSPTAGTGTPKVSLSKEELAHIIGCSSLATSAIAQYHLAKKIYDIGYRLPNAD